MTDDSILGSLLEEWRPLNPKSVALWRAQGAISATILGVALGVPLWVFANLTWGAFLATMLAPIPMAVLLVLTLWSAKATYATWRYALTEHDLAVAKGIFWKSRRYVPRVRIQHVDIASGPIGRRLGLVSLDAFVAGASGAAVQIPGLGPEVAEDLRRRLLDVDDEEIAQIVAENQDPEEPSL